MKSGSKLERVLGSGQFAVTAEAGPPRGCDAQVMLKKGELLKGSCDERRLMNGLEITGEVPLFIGAVAHPTLEASSSSSSAPRPVCTGCTSWPSVGKASSPAS